MLPDRLEGLSPVERCRVPATDVHAPGKVRKFHVENPNKPAPFAQQPRENPFQKGDSVSINWGVWREATPIATNKAHLLVVCSHPLITS